jgi:hypothetical protein
MAIGNAKDRGDARAFEIGEAELLESEAEQEGETGEVFDELDVAELASRLLGAKNETEFDTLLGGVLSHAAQQVGESLTAPLGGAVGGLLKNLAKQMLPRAATILGDRHNAAGSPWASMLGLELEGLQEVEAEFECTKQYIRLAGETVRNALETEATDNPRHLADAAITTAAKVYAPALSISPAPSEPSRRPRRNGRWVRVGDLIIVLGM